MKRRLVYDKKKEKNLICAYKVTTIKNGRDSRKIYNERTVSVAVKCSISVRVISIETEARIHLTYKGSDTSSFGSAPKGLIKRLADHYNLIKWPRY